MTGQVPACPPAARPVLQGPLVLDTNVALDLLVFDDPATRGLARLLAGAAVSWLATAAMRDELQRVLTYRHIAARLLSQGQDGAGVLLQFDRLSRLREVAAPAAIRCSDGDDQMFVDLAVAHRAVLLSKDHAVLRLHRRLLGAGAGAWSPGADWPPSTGAAAVAY